MSGHGEADKGKHSQASVFDFLDLELFEVTRNEGCEDTAGVANIVSRELVVGEDRILILRSRGFQVVSTLGFNPMHNKEFESKETRERDRELKGSSGSVPEDIGVGDFLSEDTSYTEHGPSAMYALGLTVRIENLGVSGSYRVRKKYQKMDKGSAGNEMTKLTRLLT